VIDGEGVLASGHDADGDAAAVRIESRIGARKAIQNLVLIRPLATCGQPHETTAHGPRQERNAEQKRLAEVPTMP